MTRELRAAPNDWETRMESFTATAKRSAEVAVAVAQHPERFRVLTGERPTGPLHLGHYMTIACILINLRCAQG